jgi:TadE-like protein
LSHIRSRATDESGQALVEFALVIPVLLLVLLAVLDFGKAFNYWMDATHISAEGARYAAVNRKPNSADSATLQQQLLDQADTGELRDGGSGSLPNPAQVCVSFPNGTSLPGDPVKVTMQFTYNWMPPIRSLVPGGDHIAPTTTVTSSSTMRLEATPTNYAAGCA